jgi:hypothetical protein
MACGSHNDGSVVPAHSNFIDKGMGFKAPDWAWAAMDARCHAEYDQGKDMSREDRRAFWLNAFWKTQAWLWSSGLICVAEDPVPHINPAHADKPSRPIPKGPKLQGRSSFPTGRTIPKRPWPKKADRT